MITPPWHWFVGLSLLDLVLHLAVPIGFLLAGYGVSGVIRKLLQKVRAKQGRR